MKCMILLLAVGYVVVANGAPSELPLLHPGGVGGILKGPNSETIINGPDGSIITAAAEGGAVHTDVGLSQPIIAADAAIAQPAIIQTASVEPLIQTAVPTAIGQQVIQTASIAPIAAAPIAAPITAVGTAGIAVPTAVLEPAPAVAVVAAPAEPHRVDIELVDAPDVEPDQSADLVGPSGSISTRGSKSIVSGPASTTISEPVRQIPVVSSVALAAPAAGLVAPGISVAATPILSAPAAATTTIEQLPATATLGVAPALASSGTISTTAQLAASISPVLGAAATPIAIGSTAAPLPIAIGSTPSPLQLGIASTLVPLGAIASTTAAPPLAIASTTGSPLSIATATGAPTINLGATAGTIGGIPLVEHASSQGIISQAGTIASTVAPGTVTTLRPDITNNIDLTGIDNSQQLNINPALISSQNIIPPEIGIPQAAPQLLLGPTPIPQSAGLGSSTASSLAAGGGAIVDGRLGSLAISQNQLAQQNEGLLYNTNQIIGNAGLDSRNLIQSNDVDTVSAVTGIPLLRDTRPIGQGGPLGTALKSQGIDTSQIQLDNIPLSEVSPIAGSESDTAAAVWNRYGRDVKDKKTKA